MYNTRISIKPASPDDITDHVIWVDSDKLRIVFTTLVIDARAIQRAMGSIEAFVNRFQLPVTAQTNGRLITFSEMSFPGHGILHIIEHVLEPIGLRETEDYRIVSEQPTHPFYNTLNKPIPGTEDLRWLVGVVEETGCFVSGI